MFHAQLDFLSKMGKQNPTCILFECLFVGGSSKVLVLDTFFIKCCFHVKKNEKS